MGLINTIYLKCVNCQCGMWIENDMWWKIEIYKHQEGNRMYLRRSNIWLCIICVNFEKYEYWMRFGLRQTKTDLYSDHKVTIFCKYCVCMISRARQYDTYNRLFSNNFKDYSIMLSCAKQKWLRKAVTLIVFKWYLCRARQCCNAKYVNWNDTVNMRVWQLLDFE